MADYWVDYSIAVPGGSGTPGDPYSSIAYMASNSVSVTGGDHIKLVKGPADVSLGSLQWAYNSDEVIAAGVDISGSVSPYDLIAKTIDSVEGWWEVQNVNWDGVNTTIKLFHSFGGTTETVNSIKVSTIDVNAGSNAIDFMNFNGSSGNPISISGGWDTGTGIQDGWTVVRNTDGTQAKDSVGFAIGKTTASPGMEASYVNILGNFGVTRCMYGICLYDKVEYLNVTGFNGSANQYGAYAFYDPEDQYGDPGTYHWDYNLPVHQGIYFEDFVAASCEVSGAMLLSGYRYTIGGENYCHGSGGHGFVIYNCESITSITANNCFSYDSYLYGGYDEVSNLSVASADFSIFDLDLAGGEYTDSHTMPPSNIFVGESPELVVTGTLSARSGSQDNSGGGVGSIGYALVSLGGIPFCNVDTLSVDGNGNGTDDDEAVNGIYLYGRNMYVQNMYVQNCGYCGVSVEVTDAAFDYVDFSNMLGIPLFFSRSTGHIGEAVFDDIPVFAGAFGFCNFVIDRMFYTNFGKTIETLGLTYYAEIPAGFTLDFLPLPISDFQYVPFVKENPYAGKTDSPQIRFVDWNGTGESVSFNMHGEIKPNTSEAESGRCIEITVYDKSQPFSTNLVNGLSYSYPVKAPIATVPCSANTEKRLTFRMKQDASFVGIAQISAFVNNKRVHDWSTVSLTTSYQTISLNIAADDIGNDGYITVFLRARTTYTGAGTNEGKVYVDSMTAVDYIPSYQTWSTTRKTSTMVLSGLNLVATVTGLSSGFAGTRISGEATSGKKYVEFTLNTLGASPSWIGLGFTGTSIGADGAASWTNPSLAADILSLNLSDGSVWTAGGMLAPAGTYPTFSSGDTVRMAMDFDTKEFWFGGPLGWFIGDPAVPGTGSDLSSFPSPIYFYIISPNNNDRFTINCGQNAFVYVLPTGYIGWKV